MENTENTTPPQSAGAPGSALLPCPFCESPLMEVQYHGRGDTVVVCRQCCAQGPVSGDGKPGAVKHWNRRSNAEQYLREAGSHLTNYQAGGEPQDVVDACEEMKLADEMIQGHPGLAELAEGLDTLADIIHCLWGRLQQMEPVAEMSPTGRRITAALARKQAEENPMDLDSSCGD